MVGCMLSERNVVYRMHVIIKNNIPSISLGYIRNTLGCIDFYNSSKLPLKKPEK